jgi:hypothetical protein
MSFLQISVFLSIIVSLNRLLISLPFNSRQASLFAEPVGTLLSQNTILEIRILFLLWQATLYISQVRGTLMLEVKIGQVEALYLGSKSL